MGLKEAFNLPLLIMTLTGIVIMIFVMRTLFKNSILYNIGVSTGSAMILVTFITSIRAALDDIHLIWVFPLIIAIAVSAYIYISKVIKKPLSYIVGLIGQVKQGHIKENLDTRIYQKNDEIGLIARNLQELQKGLMEKAMFARKIGEGKFDDSFT